MNYINLQHNIIVDKHLEFLIVITLMLPFQVGETPTLPRIAKRQEHRSNTPVENCEICEKQPCHHQVLQYYQRNVAVPFVDHIKMELKERFSGNQDISILSF